MPVHGITDQIHDVLVKAEKPLRIREIIDALTIPHGWTKEKLHDNVRVILGVDLKYPERGRWTRVGRGYYQAVKLHSWIKPGTKIRHKITGAIVVIEGRAIRHGRRSSLNKWSVTRPGKGSARWELPGTGIEAHWEPIR